MKKYYKVLLLLLLFCVSCSTFYRKNIYGTYYFYSETKKEVLQNWTSLTVNADGSFILKVPYIYNGESIYGTWNLKNDSLYLKTEYLYKDVNIIPQNTICKSGYVQLTIKLNRSNYDIFPDYKVAIRFDSINKHNDTVFSWKYYEMDNDNTIYVPYDTIIKAKYVALDNKVINYPVYKGWIYSNYKGRIRQESALFKDGYKYDMIFMEPGSLYPILNEECYIFENDTLKRIIKYDETRNLTIKYVKTKIPM